MSRALRLHEKHTKAELVEKLDALKADPAMQSKGDIWMLNAKGQRLMDDLLLAIYWHDRPNGNTHMAAEKPQTKWW